MDGYELAQRLRAIPKVRESRLIAVTGYGTMADKQAFAAVGFDHYLPKLPDVEELSRILSKR
jgi:CheY-like chemotaxis protein